MHHKKYIRGMVLCALLFISPFPAIAKASNTPRTVPHRSLFASTAPTKTYPFSEVWSLILKYQSAGTSHFSPELVSCLMWEESAFRLVENPRSHALGFGQIMPSTLAEINKRYKTGFTRPEMSVSPEASVQATLLALELMWEWKREKMGALYAYAGGHRNALSVRKWITAEPTMIQARWTEASMLPTSRTGATQQMIAGLRICSQPGFNPTRLFD